MISVVVPIYNVEDYLEECLLSIVSQTYTNLEIICVNDCTMDNSVNTVRKFMAVDPRVRLVSHPENRGLGGARNTGIREAKGEYIMFIDSDDAIAPTMIEKMERAIREYDTEAVICGISLFSDGQETKYSSGFHKINQVGSRMIPLASHKERLTDIWPSAWNKLYRTSLVRQYGCQFPERLLYEDHFFFYSYFAHVSSVYFIDEPLYRYRASRQGSITSTATGREKEIFTVLNSLEPIFSSTFDEENWRRSYAKIAFRLTWERQSVLWNSPVHWLSFASNAQKWLLDHFTHNELLEAADRDIDPMDPFYRFISYSGLKKFLFKVKVSIKKYPVLVRIYEKCKGIRYFRTNRGMLKELFYVGWSSYNTLNELKHPIYHTHEMITEVHNNGTKENTAV